MSEIFRLVAEEGAVVQLKGDASFSEGIEDLLYAVDVFVNVVRVDNHLVDIEKAKSPLQFRQYYIQCTLICCWCDRETKQHSNALIRDVMEDERDLVTIFRLNPDFPVSIVRIQGFEDLSFFKRVDGLVHPKRGSSP